MLLNVFRSKLTEKCVLSIVTRDPVEEAEGVTVHRAEANAPLLSQLYSAADLFVLPTQAECFGIATIEALASGLPVIMGKVGAAEEIVLQDKTGWLIEPNEDALGRAIEHAIAMRNRLPA